MSLIKYWLKSWETAKSELRECWENSLKIWDRESLKELLDKVTDKQTKTDCDFLSSWRIQKYTQTHGYKEYKDVLITHYPDV